MPAIGVAAAFTFAAILSPFPWKVGGKERRGLEVRVGNRGSCSPLSEETCQGS